MISWLEQVFTAKDFWISLSVAIVFFLAGKFWNACRRMANVLFQRRRDFSLNGFWIGTCTLPSYGEKYCVEIWKIVQRGEAVDLVMFSFAPAEPFIDYCSGSGVVKGATLSAIYYSCHPESTESGVLALKVKGRKLVGSYAQYDPGDPAERFFASDTTYTLWRLQLPWFQSIRMILGRPPVASLLAADNIYRVACKNGNAENSSEQNIQRDRT